jgi:p-aminobenzoyl-glutamate transporter AbgT
MKKNEKTVKHNIKESYLEHRVHIVMIFFLSHFFGLLGTIVIKSFEELNSLGFQEAYIFSTAIAFFCVIFMAIQIF